MPLILTPLYGGAAPVPSGAKPRYGGAFLSGIPVDDGLSECMILVQ